MTRILSAAFFLLWWMGCSTTERESPTQGSITLLASESLAPLMQQGASEFHRIYPAVHVTVVPVSTREAIVALLNDSVSAVATDRPLNTEEVSVMTEAELPIMETTIGEDALVVVVNKKNALQWLSLPDLERILSGAATEWEQIPQSGRSGRIRVSLTGRNSGLYELLQRHFFRMERDITIHVPASTQEVIMDEVEKNPSTLGIVSFSFFKSTTQPASRSIQIADSSNERVSPSQQTIYSKAYPLSYPLFLYIKEKRAGPGSGFATFLTTEPAGQKIIQNAGILPVKIPSRPIQLVQEQ